MEHLSTPAEIRRRIRDRLLSIPAIMATELEQQGTNPDDPLLIRLRRDDGEMQLPAFQFSADGTAYDIVRTVNKKLLVERDPWAVADWWVNRNGWIDGTPSDYIGRGELCDDLLTQLADGVGSD